MNMPAPLDPYELQRRLPALAHRRKINLQVLIALMGALPLLVSINAFVAQDAGRAEVWLAAGLALLALLLSALVALGHTRYVMHAVVIALVAVAALSAPLYGSVRSTASFLYPVAVATAGLMLSRRWLLLTLAACAALIAGLTLYEMHQGFDTQPAFAPGWAAWRVPLLTVLAAAGVLHHHRSHTQDDIDAYLSETRRRLMAEAQRDESLDRFFGVFHAVPTPLLVQSGKTGAILASNPAFERALGYSERTVLGVRSMRFLWADPPQCDAYEDELLRCRVVRARHVKGRHAEGHTLDMLVTSEIGDDPQDHLIITAMTLLASHPAATAAASRPQP